jgi:hypothetical protein
MRGLFGNWGEKTSTAEAKPAKPKKVAGGSPIGGIVGKLLHQGKSKGKPARKKGPYKTVSV